MSKQLTVLAASVTALAGEPAVAAEVVVPRVVSVRPHDPTAFTQGLLLYNGSLYESTGTYGSSTLREVNPQTGEVIRSTDLDASNFAEGLARVGDELIQLTWQGQVAYRYEVATFSRTGSFGYSGEGWGLCFDGQRLVMSNGGSSLTFRDPATFAVLDSVEVTLDGQAVSNINELECVDSLVYANIWQSDAIVRIDSTTGIVSTVIDASGLLAPQEAHSADVLNGIAHDPASGNFLVTGKYWPRLFELDFSGGAPRSRPGGRCTSAPGEPVALAGLLAALLCRRRQGLPTRRSGRCAPSGTGTARPVAATGAPQAAAWPTSNSTPSRTGDRTRRVG